ncbi:DUF2851 family protein [Mucilaginibacter lacusdianchii]|uniref:DUF2851 family protein n=1 Tax=Mucilaginibacter lacusdianchii TaxID=2684211 RepID=UPI00131DA4EE|nr:DUF2851 family protein [Mucilaginibacter sp. JXJ CY 39]
MLFTEDFLHYVWKFRLFDHNALQTTDNETLHITSPGLHNTHSGPDFQNARLSIGDTIWAGNVEIHLASSDWHKHHHTNDGAYHNVVLHVVYENDEQITLPDGRRLPTLILKGRIAADLYSRYHQLAYGNQRIIPCEGTIKTVSSLSLHNWLTRVLVERLEKKSDSVIATLQNNRGDWEETFYQHLAANFGFKVNALPFELMAKSLPQNLLAKNKNNPMQIEALIFGQAGFLEEDFKDDYPNKLRSEYQYLRKKYGLSPIEKHLWKFMRLRPQNFPTIRLAQFAALIVQSNHLFSKILEIKEIEQLRELFTSISVNVYWESHYRFDAESKPATKNLGQGSIDLLLMNTVAVFLFSYGNHHQLQRYIDRGMQLLEDLPVESNHVVTDFEALGIKVKTAFESQALLELKNSYCNHKKCLTCGVGNQILNIT